MRLELTKRSDYAIRACLYLAMNREVGPVPSRRIASEMDVPERFLARVMAELADAGIVEAQIGRAGGYRLVRDASTLSIFELIEIVEGTSRSTRCVLRQAACDPGRACAFHLVWARAQSALIDVLSTSNLAQVANATGNPAAGRPGPTSAEGVPA